MRYDSSLVGRDGDVDVEHLVVGEGRGPRAVWVPAYCRARLPVKPTPVLAAGALVGPLSRAVTMSGGGGGGAPALAQLHLGQLDDVGPGVAGDLQAVVAVGGAVVDRNCRVWKRLAKVWPLRVSSVVQLLPSADPCRVQSRGSRVAGVVGRGQRVVHDGARRGQVELHPAGLARAPATWSRGRRRRRFSFTSPPGWFSPLAVTATLPSSRLPAMPEGAGPRTPAARGCRRGVGVDGAGPGRLGIPGLE